MFRAHHQGRWFNKVWGITESQHCMGWKSDSRSSIKGCKCFILYIPKRKKSLLTKKQKMEFAGAVWSIPCKGSHILPVILLLPNHGHLELAAPMYGTMLWLLAIHIFQASDKTHPPFSLYSNEDCKCISLCSNCMISSHFYALFHFHFHFLLAILIY